MSRQHFVHLGFSTNKIARNNDLFFSLNCIVFKRINHSHHHLYESFHFPCKIIFSVWIFIMLKTPIPGHYTSILTCSVDKVIAYQHNHEFIVWFHIMLLGWFHSIPFMSQAKKHSFLWFYKNKLKMTRVFSENERLFFVLDYITFECPFEI